MMSARTSFLVWWGLPILCAGMGAGAAAFMGQGGTFGVRPGQIGPLMLLGGYLAAVGLLAVIFRVDVVRLWPRTASAYAGVGLPVNSLGLVIEGVRFEPSLQEGHAALAVSGMIRNIENEPVVTPPLRISLLNAEGKAVATKIARPADARIPPGETRHFAIALLDPPASAKELEVAFAPREPVNLNVKQGDPAPVAPKAAGPALRPAAEPPAPVLAPVEAQPLPPGSPDALPSHD